MKEQILDAEEQIPSDFYYQKSKKNLKVAFVSTIAAILLLVFRFNFNFLVDVIMGVAFFCYAIAAIASLLGVVNALKSYWKREQNTASRFFTLLGNGFIFSLFCILLIANFIDIIRAM